MTSSPISSIKPADVYRALVDHPKRWLVPTLAIAALSLVYAVLRPSTWEAAQALIVRDEAAGGAPNRPGKFTHADEMKTSQETILELTKSRAVLEQALIKVGPENGTASEDWPSLNDVEALQDAVKVSPPKGAEFGKTEVFYLKVQSRDSERSVALASAICEQLQKRFETLRAARAQSITEELVRTVSLAQADLDESTVALSAVEREIGPDLAELRMLNESPSGDSNLRRTSVELESELRTYRAAQNANQELLSLLEHAQVDPGRLLASPSKLLESQPALKRLKDGLVDAQLKTAQLLGIMSADHPQVVNAKDAEQQVSDHLHDELAIAIRGVQLDLRLTDDRVAALEQQRDALLLRFDRLASLRAQYSNLVATAKHRTEILKTAQSELAESRASQAAARTASLITLVDDPDAGSRPIGPGRTVITLAGALGGLLISLGVVCMTVHPNRQRRASDAASQSADIEPAIGAGI